MKKRTKIMVVIIMVLFLCVGCTKTLKDGKEVIQYEKTGQTLTANILCKPSEEELLKTYEKYDDKLTTSLEDLKTCKEFTPKSIKYKSLWESVFVKPIAYLILKLGYLVKNMGISVMLIGLIIRILLMPFQIKTVKQSESLQKIQPEMEKIEKKYKNKTDNESLMAKSQETMMLYKKYKVNPITSCLTALIQMPIFFAFLEAINRVPAIFEGSLFGMNLGMTPSSGIAHHNYVYIVLVILIIVSTYLSFKISMKSTNTGNSEMQQQMKFMFTFMILMISFASLSLPTAIALYWIVTNGFGVIQNLFIKKFMGERK